MHGQGVYTWADGRIYEGEYRNDKKHGYGIYKWADGRIYQGWWYKGKQYGLGKYLANSGIPVARICIEVKFGLWENGRRIKWFTKEEAAQITSGDLKHRECLKNAESLDVIAPNCTFDPPQHFQYKASLI